jgi:metal transporter CNNM
MNSTAIRLLQDDPAPLEEAAPPIDPINFVFIVVLATMSGAFSGLNLGLLGLDVKNLELLTRGPFNNEEEAQDAERAKKILPIRRRGNWLLCTILIGNVMVNSALSILLGDLTSGLIGLLLSTAIITIFGEIIP